MHTNVSEEHVDGGRMFARNIVTYPPYYKISDSRRLQF